MQITCSSCQAKIRVPDSAAGKKGKCPKCGTAITIPAAEPPTEELSASGSPFDFGGEAPAAPPRKGKSPAAEDEIQEEPADAGPAPTGRKQPESSGLAITSLVLGILCLLCSCGSIAHPCVAVLPLLLGIGAIITGFLGMKRGGRTLAIVGLSLGGVGVLLAIILAVVAIFASAAILAALNLQNMQHMKK
jgi:predicted Zn finger-like uncharacterized protein